MTSRSNFILSRLGSNLGWAGRLTVCVLGGLVAPGHLLSAQSAGGQGKAFVVTVDEAVGGRFEVSPTLPENGQVKAGTVLTLKGNPEPGLALDSLYSSFKGFNKWTVYRESMISPWEVTVDRDMRIGASFIESSELEGFTVSHDIVYAQPGVKPLKYDVYQPDGADNLPCIVIIHGGGWTANNEDVMRGLARELVRSGDYVVFSVDYRWLKKRDGDEEPNTMADLIGDVFGAIAHIQEHAVVYGADATRIAVTGDSAGGHLSASVANMADMIGEGGFGETDGVFDYLPSYLPEGKPVTEVRAEISAAIRAAAPSYGVFGAGEMLKNMTGDKRDAWWEAIAPIKTIPAVRERKVSQLLLRGTKDWIKHEHVQAYADALQAAGQRVEYVQFEGARHAFLDWKPDPKVQKTFREFGVRGADTMKAFFDSVFFPEQ
jgi:acetyl esterase/lipase